MSIIKLLMNFSNLLSADILFQKTRVYGVDRHHFSCFGVEGVDVIALDGSKT